MTLGGLCGYWRSPLPAFPSLVMCWITTRCPGQGDQVGSSCLEDLRRQPRQRVVVEDTQPLDFKGAAGLLALAGLILIGKEAPRCGPRVVPICPASSPCATCSL